MPAAQDHVIPEHLAREPIDDRAQTAIVGFAAGDDVAPPDPPGEHEQGAFVGMVPIGPGRTRLVGQQRRLGGQRRDRRSRYQQGGKGDPNRVMS